MAGAQFQQTTSFTRRLRGILIIIAGFFVLGVIASYYTSQGFLKGVQSISTANSILNLTGLNLAALETADQNLDKVATTADIRHLRYSFIQSMDVIQQQLNQSITLARNFPEALEDLLEARRALAEYQNTGRDLFDMSRVELEARSTELTQSEAMIAKEYSADAREALRKVQIHLKEQSDNIFNRIYQNRFLPLMVGGVLSVLFFTFVIVVGLAAARRLARGLGNLASATEAVARGELDFQAPVLEHDEFGKLTHEFNWMVTSLQQKQKQIQRAVDRVTRLQNVTAALAEAITPEQVFEVIFDEAFEALGASSGAVGLVDAIGENMKLQRIRGYSDEEASNRWSTFPLTTDIPMCIAIRNAEPIFVQFSDELKVKFPTIYEVYEKYAIRSSVSLPIMIEGAAVGAMSFSYKVKQEFNAEEKEFLLTLAGQCSQAYHRAQLYQAACEAIKVRDEFLSIASHELRTPLTPLKLQLQNLSRQVRKGNMKVLSPELLIKTVESSDRQVDRLTNLVDDLLDVSRISAGKLTLNKESFDLAEMVSEVVNNYTQQLREINTHIEVDAETGLTGKFDRVRIEQVLINLLTNAAKYAPGKPIKITLKRAGYHAKLMVTDRGQGISEENQRRIFDRFERVQDKNNVGGLGLGLYISRQIVEAHEGRISVQSQSGEGATFIVELPLYSGAELRPS